MAISLYRKYRPQTFEDVVGQESIERTLMNAVSEGNTSHAYLFCGPRGTGKTTTARLLAKALLCEKGPTAEPCGVCDQCKEIAAGTHPDVYELDAASRTGVDNVREEIIGRVAFAPTRGRCKVYIIDEVHMLSVPAFNALLKTLEEPPSHVVFILCTTDPHKVLDTILSHCQRFDFHRISVPDIVRNLRMICGGEGFTATDEALELIARHSLGGMRDAITTLEQLSVYGSGTITTESAEDLLGEVESGQLENLARLIAARDVVGCFDWVAGFVESGTDIAQFSHEMTSYVRDLYLVSLTGGQGKDSDTTADQKRHLKDVADEFEGPDRLSRVLLILADLNAELRTATDSRLCLEIALTRMAHPGSEITLESLAERIETLEHGMVASARRAASPLPASQAVTSAQPTAHPVPSAQSATRATSSRPVSQATSGTAATSAAATSAFASTSASAASGNMSTSAAAASSSASVSAAAPVSGGSGSSADSARATTGAGAGPASGAVPAARTGDLDERTIVRLWRSAERELGRRRKPLAGAVMGAKPSVDENGVFVLTLPQGAEFNKRMLDDKGPHDLLGACLYEVFGREINFRVVVSDKPAGPPPTRPIEDAPSRDLFEAASGTPTGGAAAPAAMGASEVSGSTPAPVPARSDPFDDVPDYDEEPPFLPDDGFVPISAMSSDDDDDDEYEYADDEPLEGQESIQDLQQGSSAGGPGGAETDEAVPDGPGLASGGVSDDDAPADGGGGSDGIPDEMRDMILGAFMKKDNG